TTVGGKREFNKDMGAIVMAHRIPYVATACISYPEDLYKKVTKAKKIRGPKYIEILTPCPPGWRFSMDKTVEVGRLAVETGAWPLYECENGKMSFNGFSKLILEGKVKRKPIEEWLKMQGRFRNLFKPKRDEERIRKIEEFIERMWENFRSKV
ncbi:MAG: pyruvate synthase subunit beta, partial [Thermoprotei archaeon]